MKSKKVLIPVLLLVALIVALGLFWAKQKSEEREVLVSQEVIPEKEEPKKAVTKGLVNEELKEEGRNFQLRLVAEVKADPRSVYDTLVDFEHLKELIPDCTKFEVVEAEGTGRSSTRSVSSCSWVRRWAVTWNTHCIRKT